MNDFYFFFFFFFSSIKAEIYEIVSSGWLRDGRFYLSFFFFFFFSVKAEIYEIVPISYIPALIEKKRP